jgi:hypothetical protein
MVFARQVRAKENHRQGTRVVGDFAFVLSCHQPLNTPSRLATQLQGNIAPLGAISLDVHKITELSTTSAEDGPDARGSLSLC